MRTVLQILLDWGMKVLFIPHTHISEVGCLNHWHKILELAKYLAEKNQSDNETLGATGSNSGIRSDTDVVYPSDIEQTAVNYVTNPYSIP